MKSKCLLILFYVFLFFSAKGQLTFENVISDITADIPISVIEMDNGFIVCAQGYVNIWPSIKLYRTDSIGNVIWFKFVGNDSTKGYSGGNSGSFRKVYDNTFIVGGSVGDYSLTQREMLIMRIKGWISTKKMLI